MASLRDLAVNLDIFESVRPAVLDATTTGQVVDTRGFDSACVVVQSGAIAGSGDFTAKLQHSLTTTAGDFADVTADDLQGTFKEEMTANTIEKVGYLGDRRYLRVIFTKNGGTSIAAGASVILGNANLRPV